jgi:hypothetical protein
MLGLQDKEKQKEEKLTRQAGLSVGEMAVGEEKLDP